MLLIDMLNAVKKEMGNLGGTGEIQDLRGEPIRNTNEIDAVDIMARIKIYTYAWSFSGSNTTMRGSRGHAQTALCPQSGLNIRGNIIEENDNTHITPSSTPLRTKYREDCCIPLCRV